ncbi:CHAT domain-containing protein [Olleya sp. YS]|uniref:CHAT domain-containing protein n=1 Tax=Olleya sp. YS TaxID=3028318 RepID=UPI00243456BF|nr:CHAT domain-containing protein [Olleya sp. YS]WGD35251.1 CHAT domain-containing protein [Olleya sp. YS]
MSNKSAAVFNNLKELENNFKTLDSLFDSNTDAFKNIASITQIKNSYLYDKATYLYKLNNYEEAKKKLNLLIDNTEHIADSLLIKNDIDLVYGAYSFLAKILSNTGELDVANQYYDKNIRFINKINDAKKDERLSSVYRLKGEVYKKLKKYKASNLYLKKAFNYSVSSNLSQNDIINEANTIAENFIALKQYDSAFYYLEQIKSYADTNAPYGFLYYNTKAKLDEAMGNTNTVKANYINALDLLNKKWKGLKHVEIANTLQSYSNYLTNTGKFQDALKQNTLAIQQVQGRDVVNSSINQITLFKLLEQKGKIQLRLNLVDSVISTTKQAAKLLDTLKPTFKNKSDKLLLIENAYTLFENGLDATYSKYKLDKKQAIEDAFFFLEKSKSTLLLESLLGVKAEHFSNIPKDILAREQIYKIKITNLEKQINRQQNDAIKDQLFATKTNYRQFLDTLETSYKDYYNLKYDTSIQTLSALQNQLHKTEAVVSYFYGNQTIYTLTITNNTVHFNKIDVTKSLDQLIKTFQRQLSNPKSDLKQLQLNANQLYSILLEPGLKNTLLDRLTILPDGLLNYIPFEALIKDTNYLVEDYSISYINSATLLKEIQTKKGHKNNLLAFAPEFEGNELNSDLRASLQPLPHSKTEIQNINQYYNGTLYTNQQASLDNFKTNASNYGIIHLATHAIFDDTNPEFSYLAFGNQESDLLYVADLYNLNLNANLVTLSACESGIGNLKRGEGLLSLARGFYFSGAQSISSTLWKINDASSASLMSNFYENLSKGHTKSKALQEAKVNFVKSNKDNALSHPYYWSGFIISGHTEALTTTNYWLWIGISLIGVLLLWLLFRKKTS